jgi:hypothetical protein
MPKTKRYDALLREGRREGEREGGRKRATEGGREGGRADLSVVGSGPTCRPRYSRPSKYRIMVVFPVLYWPRRRT